jgi:hypothetical protein
MFDQLLKALGGGNFGDIEKNAGDLLTRLEKLGADVIGSNGNVLAAVVSLAEDFATIKSAIGDLKSIVEDLKSLGSAASAPANVATPISGTAVAVPTPQAAPAFSLDSALSAVAQLAHVMGTGDPFAPKPLAKPAASVMEPKGGA